jgi:DNA-directed RNA polymerase beta subunit
MKNPVRHVLLGGLLAVLPVAQVAATSASNNLPTGGVKVNAIAKGDCAQNARTIVVTDATTTCSIEITVSPAKRYADVSLIVPRSKTSYALPMFIKNDGKVKVTAKGKASVNVEKSTASSCIITEGTEKIVAQVTNSKNGGRSFTTRAASTAISVTFQQGTPGIGVCFVTLGS